MRVVLAFVGDIRIRQRFPGNNELVADTFVRRPACLSDLEALEVIMVI